MGKGNIEIVVAPLHPVTSEAQPFHGLASGYDQHLVMKIHPELAIGACKMLERLWPVLISCGARPPIVVEDLRDDDSRIRFLS